MKEKLAIILNQMADCLSAAQLKKLQKVLLRTLTADGRPKETVSNDRHCW
ncbi:MAG: hypothetical protein Q4F00_03355 [bacterium]|nr:hypothetical protein [bacterium]